MQHRMSRAISLLTVWLSLAIGISVCVASDPSDGQLYDIDIPSLNAAEALNRLAEQTGAIMLFPYDLAETRQANALLGRFTLMDALSELLKDSGLSSGLSDKRVIQIALDETVDRNTEEEDMAKAKIPLRTKVGTFLVSLFVVSGVSDLVGVPRTPQLRENSILELPMSKRKKYSKEFKQDAVRLVTEQGYSIAESARNLCLNANMLARWKKESEESEDAFRGNGKLTPEQLEVRQLRSEVKQLRLEREILKKATAFFVNESK